MVARLTCLAVVALTVSLYMAGVWDWLGQMQQPCWLSICERGRVPAAVQRAFADLHLSAGFFSGYALAVNVLFAVGYAAIGAPILWRRSADPLALGVFLTLVVFGAASFEDEMSALRATSHNWELPVAMLRLLGGAAFGVFVAVFPNGRFVPRWTLLVAGAWTLWLLPNYLFRDSPFDFNTWPAAPFFGVWALFLIAMVFAQVYRFRYVSTPTQRQQTKWVVFGFVAAAVGYFGGKLILFFLAPSLTSPSAVLAAFTGGTLKYASVLLIPICIGIAMLRHHLFDIDLIIKQTLVYSILAVTLALLYEGGALVIEKGLLTFTGESGLVAEVAVAFVVGALAAPLHRGIEYGIARVFNRRKYEAERRIEAFSKQLRQELDVETMSEHVEGEVKRWMEHAWAGVWRRSSPTSEYIQEPLFP
jgi:hypothetical protein